LILIIKLKVMTLYEVLSLIAPVATVGVGCLVTRLNSKMDKFDDRLGAIEKEVYFIKGLIEGKNSNTPSK
jgi:hypothetical protein